MIDGDRFPKRISGIAHFLITEGRAVEAKVGAGAGKDKKIADVKGIS